MNDDQIFELMRREASQAPLGDGRDLARGRARLHRRRLLTGTTGVAGVAGVALAAVLVGGYVAPNGNAGLAPDPSETDEDRVSDLEQYRENMAIAGRSVNAIAEAVVEHTRFEEFGRDVSGRKEFGAGYDGRINSTEWANRWHESGGVGFLQINIDAGHTSTEWAESCARIDNQRIGRYWPASYDSCEELDVDGRPLLVGVERRTDQLWMVVKFLSADDTLVELAFSSPDPESGADPVLHPSLAIDEMIAVVTDPRVRIHDE
jgi:hypothetical protein